MVVVVSRRSKLTAIEEAHAQASAMVEEQYQNFDVVWAKLGSFPWWPGVLFYSWDAVNEAGLELKQVQHQLVIPPPTTQALPGGKQRLTYSVLIMYLDKFDCSVVEVSPKTVCPFAINYHRLKEKPKGKNGAGFNVALERAMRLLHMNDHMTLEDLEAIAPIRVEPTEEELAEAQQQLAVRTSHGKRQKRTHAGHAAAKNAVDMEDLEDDDDHDVDDEEDGDFGSDYTDDEDLTALSGRHAKKTGSNGRGAVSKAATKNASAKAAQRMLDLSAGGKQKRDGRGKNVGKRKSAHHMETIEDNEKEGDFEIVNTSLKAAAKPTTSRKKASRKEGRIHHDVINVDEDDDDKGNDFDGDFQISVGHPVGQKKHSVLTDVKLPKHSKMKSNHESVAPAKIKKKKIKSSQLKSEQLETATAAKPSKKKGPKRHSHHDHHGLHEQSVETSSHDVESSPVQPLTLTPLSTIWTTRETSNSVTDDYANAENFARLAYKLDLLWDEAVFTDETPRAGSDAELLECGESNGGAAAANTGNERGVGKRQVRSVQQSQIRQSMLTGNLDPHTMVQCETYVPKGGGAIIEVGNTRSRGAAPQIEAPFDVVVHPDVSFVCDLHSHLATCEIIGFLGGRWDDVTNTLYIQAAFPCRSLEIEGDDGSTDVEMDPGSEIALREIIQNAELEVVGWYHSHPAFAPDPSIRDIENQTSYQQLFQRRKVVEGGKTETTYPFVGLIVGTYDQRRESPVGLFRYFHTREERLNSGMRGAVHMPYELVPRKRHYRSVLEDEKRDQLRRLPLYVEVAKALFGTDKACFVKSPKFPSDETEMQTRAIAGEMVPIKNNAATGGKNKRKPSSDLTKSGPDEAAPQSIKKKRGRQKGRNKKNPTAEVVEVDGASEVIDLITDASQELSQSQEPAIQTIPTDSISSEKPSIAYPDGQLLSGEAKIEQQVSTSQTHGQECRAASELTKSTQEYLSVVIDSCSSEGLVCDLSNSQEVASAVYENEGGAAPLTGDTNHTSLATKHEDVVPASVSSLSSHSEASFSYDASQSQSTSQSQASPHPDEVVAADEPVKSAELEDDPYAGIEIITSSEPSSVVPSKVMSTPAKTVKLLKPVNAVRNGAEVSEITDSSDVVGIFQGEALLKKEHQHGETTDQSNAVQVDEVVGDSGPDTISQSLAAGEENKTDTADVAVQQSPAESESGPHSASGGSTPIDGSLLAGRRRTRKPTLTVRRHSGAAASPGRTNVSPRSPGANSNFEGDGVGGDAVDDGSKIKIKSPEEVSTLATNGTVPAAVEQKMRVDSGWDDVEIISEDYMNGSFRSKSEMTPLKSGEESVVEVTESDASQGVTSEGDATVSRVAVTLQTEADALQVQTGTQSVKNETDAEVNGEVSATQLEEVIQSRRESEVESSGGEALQTPHFTAGFVQPSSASSAAVHVPVNTESQEARQIPVANIRGRRSKKSISMADTAGFLEEPIDRYQTYELRSTVMKMGIWRHMANADRNKGGYIAAIRAHWHELRHLPSPPVESDGKVALPLLKSTLETVDEINGVVILHEAKDVVRSLVSNVESLADHGTVLSAAPTDRGPMAAEDTAIKKMDEAEKFTHELDVTNSVKSTQLSTAKAQPPTLQDRHTMHLRALRTKYGRGVYGCTEQLITLIDYYRDFHRRTDLHEIWKAKILKVKKIEASLRADVEHVNLPVALRDAFINDVMGYLRASWQLSSAMK